MKKRIVSVISYVLIGAGIVILLFPYAGRIYNRYQEKKKTEQYSEEISDTPDNEIIQAARKYNEKLASSGDHLIEKMENEKSEEYENLLNPQGNGMMGYLEIPEINVLMPIYHDADEDSLRQGIGHIHGSSLPVGGKSTHCVLTGHRGLLTDKMLTDLDQMKKGDQFMIHVMNETLTYQVDQIQTVLPDEMDSLAIQKGKDYVTLITCTPYGVNDHRLLVRGHRVDHFTENNRKYHFSVESIVTLIVTTVVISTIIIMLAHFIRGKHYESRR